MPAPKQILRPTFDVESPNVFHQADLLFLPRDRLPRGRKVYKSAWTFLDVTSWYKDVEPLIPKDAHAPDRLYWVIHLHH